jgi:hypothetical protein
MSHEMENAHHHQDQWGLVSLWGENKVPEIGIWFGQFKVGIFCEGWTRA